MTWFLEKPENEVTFLRVICSISFLHVKQLQTANKQNVSVADGEERRQPLNTDSKNSVKLKRKSTLLPPSLHLLQATCRRHVFRKNEKHQVPPYGRTAFGAPCCLPRHVPGRLATPGALTFNSSALLTCALS